jgi:hypothetical protein
MRSESSGDEASRPGGTQIATPATSAVVHVSRRPAEAWRRMPAQPNRIRRLRSGASPVR